MDKEKEILTKNKYRLPYHWIRDPLHKYSLPYFGYVSVVLNELPSPPATVLDVGCGDGRVSAEIVRQGYAVTGIDYLELSIQYAKTMVPEGMFFVADLRDDLVANYGLNKSQFDAVVMVEVYEHIPPEDCTVVLANIYNILRPGGTLIISVPSKLLPVSKLHYRHFDRGEFERELEIAGFHVRKMIYQHHISYFTRWLLSDKVDRFLNNSWFQPIFLKRLRRYLYMRYANVVKGELHCGRFIAVATCSKTRRKE